ncbi:class I SAM-dependent methyltransferase [Flexivirga caeni]|uniref:Class I SAM-dependent methyltransferase n=1 Tax=Flexivirga caeni TaxID=2294115 RepID=A0A3M9M777_9MICO|nr:class I SAM-dependent methyltransferase [Flexivirga caeni]RNI21420.1 class I SAM-dependent methyltransferase [Flexivirga caeni]
MARSGEPWNINIHYDRLLVGCARPGSRVLDVGCGDGFLSARLAAAGCEVTALDADAGVLERARDRWADRDVGWVHGDVLSYPFQLESFDVVVSNATLHHLPDTEQGLLRLRDLLRPGGRLGVVGFARNGIVDWPMSLVGAVGILAANSARGKWQHSAPIVWPPPLTYGQVRRTSGRVLPGRHYRRLWLGRYWLSWTKPRLLPGGRAVS